MGYPFKLDYYNVLYMELHSKDHPIYWYQASSDVREIIGYLGVLDQITGPYSQAFCFAQHPTSDPLEGPYQVIDTGASLLQQHI